MQILDLTSNPSLGLNLDLDFTSAWILGSGLVLALFLLAAASIYFAALIRYPKQLKQMQRQQQQLNDRIAQLQQDCLYFQQDLQAILHNNLGLGQRLQKLEISFKAERRDITANPKPNTNLSILTQNQSLASKKTLMTPTSQPSTPQPQLQPSRTNQNPAQALTIEQAIKMGQLGCTIEDLVQHCGLNYEAAKLILELHKKT